MIFCDCEDAPARAGKPLGARSTRRGFAVFRELRAPAKKRERDSADSRAGSYRPSSLTWLSPAESRDGFGFR